MERVFELSATEWQPRMHVEDNGEGCITILIGGSERNLTSWEADQLIAMLVLTREG
jgi:hypothetical protein